MYNKPSGDTSQITIGPGIVRVGPVGATPTFDVGHVTDKMTLMFKRTRTDIKAGSPQILIEALANAEMLSLEFKGIEWDMDVLARALGDGASSVSGANEIFKFGGKPPFAKYALQFEHRMADGGTLMVNVWKVIPSGEVEATIGIEDPHDLKMKFDAMDATTDWAGAALTVGQALCSVTRTKP